MKIISVSKPVTSASSFEVGEVFVFILAAALLMSAGCGGSGGAEKARAKLAQLGKDYSPAEFISCANKGDVTAVKLFLDAGMSPNARMTGGDGKEMCALFAGCLGKDEAVVKVLVERGANPNDLSLDGQAPLWAAIVNTNLNMVRLLVDKGAKLDGLDPESEFTPLGTAAQCGAVDIMDFLLSKGAGVNGGGRTPLMGAVWRGNVEAVKLLLNHKPNLEIRDATDHLTAMDLARKKGFEEIVELLRNAGAIYCTESFMEGQLKIQNATVQAIAEGIGRRFTDKGGVDDDGLKILYGTFSEKTMAKWREEGMSQAQVATMLFAIQEKLYLGTGRALWSVQMFNTTANDRVPKAVHAAIDKANDDCWAAFEREFRSAADSDAKILNIRDSEGDSPLMVAALFGHKEFAQWVLSKGADFKTQNAEGKTALDLAQQGHHDEIVTLLNEAVAGRAVSQIVAQPSEADRKLLADVRAKAERGDAQSQYKLGKTCVEGSLGVAKDDAEAVKWWRKAAEQNLAAAQCAVGECYASGAGVAKDDIEAVKWYRKAAEQNDTKAQYNMGVCYAEGLGVAKDGTEAVKWYRKAADQNLAAAQCAVGECYASGAGVAKDDIEAVKWYRKAAEQNDAKAQYNMGVCYFNGEGVVAKDEVEAVKWYRKAAEQNDAKAQYILGGCYFNSEGVVKDEVEAVKWYLLASAQGNEDAKKSVTMLENRMSREQIAEGQKLARNFKPVSDNR